ncbi:hypothetical protein TNCV_2709461 [Trichonephila clavipes]|nr:hypothetical protein TNCV_2709461 [Trichonephila clavipes]
MSASRTSIITTLLAHADNQGEGHQRGGGALTNCFDNSYNLFPILYQELAPWSLCQDDLQFICRPKAVHLVVEKVFIIFWCIYSMDDQTSKSSDLIEFLGFV